VTFISGGRKGRNLLPRGQKGGKGGEMRRKGRRREFPPSEGE